MKVSELAKATIDFLIKHGDKDIKIDLLTENRSNFLDEHYHIDFSTYNGNFEIEVDVNNKKDLMSKIK